MLEECQASGDINRLARVRYQIQAGMDDLAKRKLNSEEIIVWYLRLMRSLEITAKRIYKRKVPMPGDYHIVGNVISLDAQTAKKLRDEMFNKFLHDSAY